MHIIKFNSKHFEIWKNNQNILITWAVDGKIDGIGSVEILDECSGKTLDATWGGYVCVLGCSAEGIVVFACDACWISTKK